jgi:hypothetical protein
VYQLCSINAIGFFLQSLALSILSVVFLMCSLLGLPVIPFWVQLGYSGQWSVKALGLRPEGE